MNNNDKDRSRTLLTWQFQLFADALEAAWAGIHLAMTDACSTHISYMGAFPVGWIVMIPTTLIFCWIVEKRQLCRLSSFWLDK